MRNIVMAAALMLGIGGAGAVAVGQPLPIDSENQPVCADGHGHECDRITKSTCKRYKVVTIQVGSTTQIVQACEEQVTDTKVYYWTT